MWTEMMCWKQNWTTERWMEEARSDESGLHCHVTLTAVIAEGLWSPWQSRSATFTLVQYWRSNAWWVEVQTFGKHPAGILESCGPCGLWHCRNVQEWSEEQFKLTSKFCRSQTDPACVMSWTNRSGGVHVLVLEGGPGPNFQLAVIRGLSQVRGGWTSDSTSRLITL